MDVLNFSQLSIRSEDEYVTFVIHGKDDYNVKVRADHIPEIVDFLRTKADTESNRRVGFRVDVAALGHSFSDRFRVFADTPEGDRVKVTPINVSLTGILVETEHYLGDQNIHSSVELVLDNINVRIPSIIVRCDHNRVAFQFIASIKDGQLDPPPELVAIFRTLEMNWLKTRVK